MNAGSPHHDHTYAGGDFLRVYCQCRHGTATTFTTIERVRR